MRTNSGEVVCERMCCVTTVVWGGYRANLIGTVGIYVSVQTGRREGVDRRDGAVYRWLVVREGGG